MTTVVGVHFQKTGKLYYFDPRDLIIHKNDSVVVETARGQDLGICMLENCEVEDERIVPPLRPVLRVATERDLKVAAANTEKEARAFEVAQQKIAARKLDMKLVDVEYTFDGSKILFYFTADGRIDFRDLVKDLAAVFRARIELRQIGVRDEAKILGGLGICGKPFCCATFLGDFQPVSIKMAKEQGLSLNPTKISGSCGRLMCCLKYEQEAYEDLLRTTPTVDSQVTTPQGPGVVTEVSLLRGVVKVRLDGNDTVPHPFNKCDVCVKCAGRSNGGGRGKRPGPDRPSGEVFEGEQS